jgi:hypothetical protein
MLYRELCMTSTQNAWGCGGRDLSRVETLLSYYYNNNLWSYEFTLIPLCYFCVLIKRFVVIIKSYLLPLMRVLAHLHTWKWDLRIYVCTVCNVYNIWSGLKMTSTLYIAQEYICICGAMVPTYIDCTRSTMDLFGLHP